jgi:hypothetical protein
MAPLPGTLLVDGPEQATVVLINQSGTPIAVGTTYFAHNSHSPHHRCAWVGMFTVDLTLRRIGLDRYTNARTIRHAIDELGADSVYELAAPTNEPSRRMVEACRLALEPNLLCGVAVPDDVARFTR